MEGIRSYSSEEIDNLSDSHSFSTHPIDDNTPLLSNSQQNSRESLELGRVLDDSLRNPKQYTSNDFFKFRR
jgi:hypothetical protein